MAQTALGGNPVETNGELPKKGSKAPDFTLVKGDLSSAHLSDFTGSRVILNIFPSIDTSTCAASVRRFNQDAGSLENTKVLCISRDLPFAQNRFCGAEGLQNVMTLSDFRDGDFSKSYGLLLQNGALQGLSARAVVVLDENQQVIHSELVPDIKDEPNYEAALSSLK